MQGQIAQYATVPRKYSHRYFPRHDHCLGKKDRTVPSGVHKATVFYHSRLPSSLLSHQIMTKVRTTMTAKGGLPVPVREAEINIREPLAELKSSNSA